MVQQRKKELFESWRLDRGTIKSPRDVVLEGAFKHIGPNSEENAEHKCTDSH